LAVGLEQVGALELELEPVLVSELGLAQAKALELEPVEILEEAEKRRLETVYCYWNSCWLEPAEELIPLQEEAGKGLNTVEMEAKTEPAFPTGS